jgi:threonine dehydrogenase-like Zn-dependent dehydrogenase
VGVDAVIIAAATDSNDPIELAGEICRDRGVVSMVGAVKMDVPRKVYYEKELQLRLSRSYGPGRYDPEYEEKGATTRSAYVRWTERRNMEEFLRLVSTGQVTPSKLTTHRFAIDEAERHTRS